MWLFYRAETPEILLPQNKELCHRLECTRKDSKYKELGSCCFTFLRITPAPSFPQSNLKLLLDSLLLLPQFCFWFYASHYVTISWSNLYQLTNDPFNLRLEAPYFVKVTRVHFWPAIIKNKMRKLNILILVWQTLNWHKNISPNFIFKTQLYLSQIHSNMASWWALEQWNRQSRSCFNHTQAVFSNYSRHRLEIWLIAFAVLI